MGSLTGSSKSNWVNSLKEPTKELRVTGIDPEANPTLEISLLMDCTGSMQSWITKAKETLNQIIDQVVEECKEEGNLQVRVSFIGYRDIKDTERFTVMPFTSDINSVKNFIAKTRADGGADTPEDLQGGLKLALLQDWTEEASKRVFLICDAPCHGKQYHSCDENYPKGSPEGLDLEEMMKEFCKKEIEFQVMKLDHNCDKMIEVMKQCHQELEVTDMTGMPQRGFTEEAMGMMDAFVERERCMDLDAVPERMCLEEQDKIISFKAPADGARGMAMPEASFKQSLGQGEDLFQQEAVRGLTSQVKRKQANIRSMRSKMA